MMWWTRRRAVRALDSVRSRTSSLHVERLRGSSSRVEGTGAAAESPVPHEQRLTRCPCDVEGSSVSTEPMRIPSKRVSRPSHRSS